jgi:hypothetical protein
VTSDQPSMATCLTIQSGDILLVALVRPRVSPAEADELKARLMQRMPGIADVVVLSGVAAILAYQPDDR